MHPTTTSSPEPPTPSERPTVRERLAVLAGRPVRLSPRRLATSALVVLAVLIPSAAWGISTARADAGLGPHTARYEVTLDRAVTLDLGPLGTVVVDSPMPFALGARVVVQEIPREVTALQGVDTLDALLGDLESYVQFFSSPASTVEVAVRALAVDALRRTLLAATTVTVTVVLVRSGLGKRRRAELAAAAAPHRSLIAGGAVVALLVVGTVSASGPFPAAPQSGPQASAVFDDTPLEGARITGRLAGVIDTYGGVVVDAYRENETFYATATANLEESWAARAEADAELARLRQAVRDIGAGAAPEDAEEPGTSDGSSSEEEDPSEGDEGPLLPEEEGVVTLLLLTDMHCNVGMAPVIRRAVELSGADVVLNGGDTTVNGTSVESYCVTALANAIPDGVTTVVADGNHDSDETSAQGRAAGMTVLDGAVVDVAGVRILGDKDPRATRIGGGTALAGEETVAGVSARLAEVACADEAGVDLMLVHDSGMAAATLEQGCAPAVVAGHMHRRIGPYRYGQGVRYIGSSVAGAALGQPTVGPLNGVAEMTVLRFDLEERRVLDYRLVQVRPDASADVGFAVRWPGAPVPSVLPGGAR
ncbi:metallophosphoesterase [Actinotalea sp. BY-33]|uniref:Metallophosphoesterase n=1 Tax=Actinotalea soli TaxID=2819234 RepID=A0A939LQG4_9CELL|nr:metallophosphoesterase [Actinotalea soli]MBO1750720.1 metallophosphoesterase [Actinotalea soli]